MPQPIKEYINTIIKVNSTTPIPDEGVEVNPALLKSQFQLMADQYNNAIETILINELNAPGNQVVCSGPLLIMRFMLPNNLDQYTMETPPEQINFTYDNVIETSNHISAIIHIKLKRDNTGEYSFTPISSKDVERCVRTVLEKASAATPGKVNPLIRILVDKQKEFKLSVSLTAKVGSEGGGQAVPPCIVVPCVPKPPAVIDAFANPEGN